MKGDEAIIGTREFLRLATKLGTTRGGLGESMAEEGKEYAGLNATLAEFHRSQEKTALGHSREIKDLSDERDAARLLDDQKREDASKAETYAREDARRAVTYAREDAKRVADARTSAMSGAAAGGGEEKSAYKALKASSGGVSAEDRAALKAYSRAQMELGIQEIMSQTGLSRGAAIASGESALMSAAESRVNRVRAEDERTLTRKEQAEDQIRTRKRDADAQTLERSRKAEDVATAATEKDYEREEEDKNKAKEEETRLKRLALTADLKATVESAGAYEANFVKMRNTKAWQLQAGAADIERKAEAVGNAGIDAADKAVGGLTSMGKFMGTPQTDIAGKNRRNAEPRWSAHDPGS